VNPNTNVLLTPTTGACCLSWGPSMWEVDAAGEHALLRAAAWCHAEVAELFVTLLDKPVAGSEAFQGSLQQADPYRPR